MSKKMKAKLESLSDKFDYTKEKEKTKNLILGWKDENNINPLDVVVKFIMDKGLKLYGAQHSPTPPGMDRAGQKASRSDRVSPRKLCKR